MRVIKRPQEEIYARMRLRQRFERGGREVWKHSWATWGGVTFGIVFATLFWAVPAGRDISGRSARRKKTFLGQNRKRRNEC